MIAPKEKDYNANDRVEPWVSKPTMSEDLVLSYVEETFYYVYLIYGRQAKKAESIIREALSEYYAKRGKK